MGKMHIADSTGHSTLEWSSEDKEAIKAASKAFEEKIASGGYFAAEYNGDSSQPENGKIVRAFNENAQEIKLLPKLVGG
jgi:hypothetical protein